MSLDPDGTGERRVASPIGSTGGIPTGTLLTVPSAPPTGAVPDARVVAVQTKTKWQSVTLYICAALPFVDFAAEQLADYLKINPSTHRAVITALALYIGWRRIYRNTVVK